MRYKLKRKDKYQAWLHASTEVFADFSISISKILSDYVPNREVRYIEMVIDRHCLWEDDYFPKYWKEGDV